MQCEKCLSPVEIDEVIVYKEDYVTPKVHAADPDSPFMEGVYLIPGA